MALLTEDGAPVDVEALNQEFHAAMARPPVGDGEPTAKAPPRKLPPDPDAPKPKRGRPSAESKPRTRAASATTADTRTPQKAAEDRAAGVAGIMQIAGGACLVAGQQGNSEALMCDAAVLGDFAQPYGEACASVAAANPAFARTLDKLISVGPFGALLTLTVQMGMQFASNHGVIDQGMAGTRTRKQIIADLEKQSDASPGN